MSNDAGKLALIIEDDATSIQVLERMLQYNGVTSITINDSFTVPDQLSAIDLPDVIFLDLEMPRSNGYSVLEYIQRSERFDGIPVVAYTTHISHLNNAKRAGFHSFLGKPLDNKLFSDQLNRILNGIPVWEVP